jgi:hypothetical protein
MRAILSDAIAMYHFDLARRVVTHSSARMVHPTPAGLAGISAGTFKTCVCGRAFTETAWAELPVLGYQDCGEYRLEYRNCRDPCGSTLAIEVAK